MTTVMQAAKGRLYGGGLGAVARIGGQCRAVWNLFLAANVLEIITVFSARLYGARSHKTKKLIEAFSEANGHAVGA
jgi:hypothetical protein